MPAFAERESSDRSSQNACIQAAARAAGVCVVLLVLAAVRHAAQSRAKQTPRDLKPERPRGSKHRSSELSRDGAGTARADRRSPFRKNSYSHCDRRVQLVATFTLKHQRSSSLIPDVLACRFR